MEMNRTKVISTAELAVWQCDVDSDTDFPSDSEVWPSDEATSASGSDVESIVSAEGMRRMSLNISNSGSGSGSSAFDFSPQNRRGPKAAGRRPQPLPEDEAKLEQELGKTQTTSSNEDGKISALFRRERAGLKALFIDYDGTLREFENRPELAEPTADVHRLLAALNQREDMVVHIISGRDAQFLSQHFGRYKRLILIAEHQRRVAGRFQVWRPESATHSSSCAAEPMEDWRTGVRFEMSRACERLPDSQVEEKASALVWHFRAVADDAAAETAAAALVARLERLKRARKFSEMKVILQSKTVEVTCRRFTKGDIVRRVCRGRAAVGEPFSAVLVAGDDVSDESMFEANIVGSDEEFVSLKVGFEESQAQYYVDSPKELRNFLLQLAA